MSRFKNAYGSTKRLVFYAEVLAQNASRLVIDICCGTGVGLTRHLAQLYRRVSLFTVQRRGYTLADIRYVLTKARFEILGKCGLNLGFGTTRPLKRVKYIPAFILKERVEVVLSRRLGRAS